MGRPSTSETNKMPILVFIAIILFFAVGGGPLLFGLIAFVFHGPVSWVGVAIFTPVLLGLAYSHYLSKK